MCSRICCADNMSADRSRCRSRSATDRLAIPQLLATAGSSFGIRGAIKHMNVYERPILQETEAAHHDGLQSSIRRGSGESTKTQCTLSCCVMNLSDTWHVLRCLMLHHRGIWYRGSPACPHQPVTSGSARLKAVKRLWKVLHAIGRAPHPLQWGTSQHRCVGFCAVKSSRCEAAVIASAWGCETGCASCPSACCARGRSRASGTCFSAASALGCGAPCCAICNVHVLS